MTSPVAAWLSWPIIGLMAITIVVRVAWLNSSIIDRLTTQSLVLGWIGLVLREEIVQEAIGRLPKPFGDVALYQQLTFCCMVMIVQAIYGMSRVWAGIDPDVVRARQKIYYTTGLGLCAIILVAGTPSRKAGQLIDEYLGWPAVVLWTAFYVPILFVSLTVLRVFAREIRQPDSAVRERALYGLAIVIAGVLAIDGAASPAVTIYEVLTGSGSADPEMRIKSLTFFGALAGSLVIGAVPVFTVLRTKVGQDRITRNLREIEVLWRDLTAEFPEVRRADDELAQDRALQLHRRIIEIHDALLRLSKWNPRKADAGTNLGAEGIAAEIGSAFSAKTRGDHQCEGYELLQLLTQRSQFQNLTATSDDVVAVARAWRNARARATHASRSINSRSERKAR